MSAVGLEITCGGLSFRNPVLTASGTFGYGSEFESLTDLSAIGRAGHQGGFAASPVRQRDAAYLRNRLGHAELDRARERRRGGIPIRQACRFSVAAARA